MHTGPDVDALRALIERVKTAREADPDLDADIYLTLGILTRVNCLAEFPDEEPLWQSRDAARATGGTHSEMVRNVTASIDAAYSLVERIYPKCAFELAWGPKNLKDDYEGLCRLWPDDSTSFWEQPKKPQAASPALAVCLALLNALISHAPKPPRKKPAGRFPQTEVSDANR